MLLAECKRGLSQLSEPLKSYKLLKSFLTLWRRVEVLKHDWGAMRLGVRCIDTPQLHATFWSLASLVFLSFKTLCTLAGKSVILF